MKKLKEQKGITLVALVITIIVLLILSAISIQALTGTGLFGKTNEAKERTIKAQLKEEIELAIQEIQVEEVPKGNNVTLETLANKLVSKLEDITATLGTNEITGEYKNYDYTIDSNLKVKIGEKVGEIKPTGKAEILTTGYMFEGDGTVEIKITASISEGTITGIEAPNGTTLKENISETEKMYTVSQNGTYVFTISGDSGRNTNVTVNIDQFLSAPHISISDIKSNEFKINVDTNYPEGVITEYKYYVGSDVKSQGTTDKSIVVTELKEETEYNNIKVVAYINPSTSKESNIEKVTIPKRGEILYSWDELSEIAHAISNTETITSDSEEASVKVSGASNILMQPEFSNADKIREIVSKFEDKSLVSSIKEEESGVNIYIGSENTLDDDVAIIKTKYSVNGEEGTIALIGPKRMEYGRATALLNYIKKNIER